MLMCGGDLDLQQHFVDPYVFVASSAREQLKRDRRQYIPISEFGLLKGGSVQVDFDHYKPRGQVAAIGFSVQKASDRASEPYGVVDGVAELDECYLFNEVSTIDETLRIRLDNVTGR